MKEQLNQEYKYVLLLAFALTVMGSVVIPPRTTQTPDTQNYVAMVEGKYSEAVSPFRYRVFVPALARVLPLQPLPAMRLITVLSLFGIYSVAMLLCFRAGAGFQPTLIAVSAYFVSRPNMYNYYDPYLTDGLGLLALFLLSLYFLDSRPKCFAAVLAVGVLARESALFVFPACFSPESDGRQSSPLV